MACLYTGLQIDLRTKTGQIQVKKDKFKHYSMVFIELTHFAHSVRFASIVALLLQLLKVQSSKSIFAISFAQCALSSKLHDSAIYWEECQIFKNTF